MSEMIKEFKKGDLLYIGDNKKAYWGLPQGYPHKEVTVTDALTWNGVSDIVVDSGGGSNAQFCFVSTIIPTQEDLAKAGSIVMSNGYEVTFDASAVFPLKNLLWVSLEDQPFIIVAPKDNCTLNNSIVFPKAGIYFISLNGLHVASFSINGYRFETETIHSMAPEFLPSATSTIHGTVKQMSYLPNATGDAPTAEEFNALLKSLRDAGILATS